MELTRFFTPIIVSSAEFVIESSKQMLTFPSTFGKRNGAFDGYIVALRHVFFALLPFADLVDLGERDKLVIDR